MANEIRARVIGQEKGLYRITDGQEERLAEISGKFQYQVQTMSDYPAVGDYVVALWPEDGSNCIIESIFPAEASFSAGRRGAKIRSRWWPPISTRSSSVCP